MMRHITGWLILINVIGCLLLATGCINSFTPGIDEQIDLLSVEGSLIKGQENQIIFISRASPMNQPEYLPVENCDVKVVDYSGNEFFFQEVSEGEYTAKIEDTLLHYNSQYKLVFSTSDGNIYESAFQTLLESPPIDSFYCMIENQSLSSATGKSSEGLQFYVNLKAPADASKYYRWKLQETWEIHAIHTINGYFDGRRVHFYPSSVDSFLTCWKTVTINGLYTASTTNLIHNETERIPLFFIGSDSKKLWIKYCATIRQYALNEDAYQYWQQKKEELYESGGMYTRQPSQFKSNVYNINNIDEQVLGFFWVSSVSLSHRFLKDPFHNYSEPVCSVFGIGSISENEEIRDSILSAIFIEMERYLPVPPFYFYEDWFGGFSTTLERICLDCTVSGGVTKRPDFWQ